MTPPAPFTQGSYADLQVQPRRPHGWLGLPVEWVDVHVSGGPSTRTAVRRLGEGPPLVLVHGLMTSGYSWRYVVEELASAWSVIVPDLPGAGDTLSDGPFDPASMARWLGAFLDAVGARGSPVVGNSMGGYLGLHLMLRDPEAMGRLLVVHAPGVPTPRLHALHAAIRLPGAGAALRAVVARDPARWAYRHVHYRDESLKSREEAQVYGAPLSTPAGRRAFFGWLRDGLDVRVMGRFVADLERRRDAGEALPIPVRLQYATSDPMVPPAVGPQLAARCPGAELVWLEDSSHFAHVDTPEAFLEDAVPWLRVG